MFYIETSAKTADNIQELFQVSFRTHLGPEYGTESLLRFPWKSITHQLKVSDPR